jgi:hypothetical protein
MFYINSNLYKIMYIFLNKKNNFTTFGIFFCALLILLSITILIKLYSMNNKETFTDQLPLPNKLSSQIPDGEDYLYPVYSLNETCESKGLLPSHVNRLCLMKDNTYKPLSNCKCEDKDGFCQICYPEVKIDNKGRSIIYNANDFS